MLAGCCQQLRNSCTAMMKICWHLQSEHTVWVDRVQSEQGGVCAVGTLESKHCLEAFGEKKKPGIAGQTSMGFFFFPFTWKRKNLFLCQMKGENFFCAWGVQREFLVPSVLNCTVVPCVRGGTTFPATWLLAVLRFHLLRIFISFQRQAPELTDFSSFNFFQRVCDEGTESTK